MHIYIYIYTYAFIYIYVYIYAHICVYLYIYIYSNMCTCISLYLYIIIFIDVYMCVCVNRCTHLEFMYIVSSSPCRSLDSTSCALSSIIHKTARTVIPLKPVLSRSSSVVRRSKSVIQDLKSVICIPSWMMCSSKTNAYSTMMQSCIMIFT